MLFDDGPFSTTAIPDDREYEGLDARHVLPPLLRPGMLMDWEAVARWEELTVAALSDHRHNPDAALEIIEQASVEVSEAWTPNGDTLCEALTAGFARAHERRAYFPRRPGAGEPRSGLACDLLTAPRKTRPTLAPALARYLASHAFACWPMYDGRGIRGAITHLRTARATLDAAAARLAAEANRALDAVLLKEAFRQADLRLRHLRATADE